MTVRGTAVVVDVPAAHTSAPPPAGGTPPLAGPTTAAVAASAATATAPPGAAARSAANPTGGTPAAKQATAVLVPAGEIGLQAGDTRFSGRFVRDGDRLSGNGRVRAANGDVCPSDRVKGRRHGRGERIWTAAAGWTTRPRARAACARPMARCSKAKGSAACRRAPA